MRDATRITPETIVGFIALSVAASLFASAAHGQALQDLAVEQQGLNERPAQETWSVTLGAGLADRPDYPGSSHYQVRPVPLIAIGYGDRFAAGPFGVGFAAIDWKGLRAGPVLGVEGGRR